MTIFCQNATSRTGKPFARCKKYQIVAANSPGKVTVRICFRPWERFSKSQKKGSVVFEDLFFEPRIVLILWHSRWTKLTQQRQKTYYPLLPAWRNSLETVFELLYFIGFYKSTIFFRFFYNSKELSNKKTRSRNLSGIDKSVEPEKGKITKGTISLWYFNYRWSSN